METALWIIVCVVRLGATGGHRIYPVHFGTDLDACQAEFGRVLAESPASALMMGYWGLLSGFVQAQTSSQWRDCGEPAFATDEGDKMLLKIVAESVRLAYRTYWAAITPDMPSM